MQQTPNPTPPTNPPASIGLATRPRIGRCGDYETSSIPASVKTDYEISFTRYFYQPLRPPHHIWADIHALEHETEGPLGEIMGGSA